MALEMFLTALLSIRKTDKSPFIFITFQSAIMFLTPTALNYSQWLFFSVFAGGAIGKINQKDEMELNIIDKVLNGET